MKWRALFRRPELRPDQVNECGQVTDGAVLGGDRIRFGAVGLFVSCGIGLLNTPIIRALGGGHFHLGLAGSMTGIGCVVEWIGAVILRKTGSCRKADALVVAMHMILTAILGAALLLAVSSAWRPFCLWAFLAVTFGHTVMTCFRNNVETTWMGDLVPRDRLGWFNGGKIFVTLVGAAVWGLWVAYLADMAKAHPEHEYFLYAAAAFCGLLLTSLALLTIRTITDRKPRTLRFFALASTDAALNYRSVALWGYVSFFFLWSLGRTGLSAFSTAFLLDMDYSMTKIVLLHLIQLAVSAGMVLVMGKVTDRKGVRVPLMLFSFLIGLSMLLWVASAWIGVIAIIAYNCIAGMAGQTHGMLAMNYGQTIFPSEGRSGYFGIMRLFVGVAIISGSLLAGKFMSLVEWHCSLWGAELNTYHLLFCLCAAAPICSSIPLLVVGKKVVESR